jgi:hypothetical protein
MSGPDRRANAKQFVSRLQGKVGQGREHTGHARGGIPSSGGGIHLQDGIPTHACGAAPDLKASQRLHLPGDDAKPAPCMQTCLQIREHCQQISKQRRQEVLQKHRAGGGLDDAAVAAAAAAAASASSFSGGQVACLSHPIAGTHRAQPSPLRCPLHRPSVFPAPSSSSPPPTAGPGAGSAQAGSQGGRLPAAA